MDLVWRITDDLPNSPNSPLPNFPTLHYNIGILALLQLITIEKYVVIMI